MKTINITPTWRGILPVWLAVMARNRPGSEAWRDATIELERMADAADAYNRLVDKRNGPSKGRDQNRANRAAQARHLARKR